MTEEEIKKLAREYAESVSFRDAEDPNIQIEYDFALPVIEWLCKRFCIVEKSKVQNLSSEHHNELRGLEKGCWAWFFYDGRKDLIRTLFGKEMFEEEQK